MNSTTMLSESTKAPSEHFSERKQWIASPYLIFMLYLWFWRFDNLAEQASTETKDPSKCSLPVCEKDGTTGSNLDKTAAENIRLLGTDLSLHCGEFWGQYNSLAFTLCRPYHLSTTPMSGRAHTHHE